MFVTVSPTVHFVHVLFVVTLADSFISW